MTYCSIRKVSLPKIHEYMQPLYGGKSDKKHSKRVCRLCKKIVKRLKNNSVDNIQSDLLYKAAYLHDIGKADCKGDVHPFMSVVCMYDSFDCSGKKSRKYARRISHIIIAHKSDFCPPKDVAIEAAILRMADKIDKYNKSKYRLKKARKSYEKNLEKIREYFRDNGLDDEFKQIETACEHERKKTEKRQINAT